jgi:hypothetical protein
MTRRTLLIIECVTRYNWDEIFKGASLTDDEAKRDGTCEGLKVEQATWDELTLVSYPGEPPNNLVVTAKATERPMVRTQRTFCPDFVLMRSESKGHWGQDSTNKLLVLLHSGVPAVNSIFSIYCFLQKPVIWAALKDIQAKLGAAEFPLIQQTLYPSFKEMAIHPDLPCVGKIGSFDAGKGKAVLKTEEALDDFRSIVAVQPAFATLEPFVDWDWDGRVQVIGPHIRVFKRTTDTWKGNSGKGVMIEDLEVTPQWQLWASECRKAFGGLDLFGLDFLHDKRTGKLVILELNGTACGLVQRHETDDMLQIRDVVLAKMRQRFNSSPPGASAEATPIGDSTGAEAVLREQLIRLQNENIGLKKQLVPEANTKSESRPYFFFRR